MTYTVDPDDGAYADLLAECLRDVTADLRTIDLVDLVSFIRFGSYPAVEDLIQSSAELFLKPGSLISSWTAGVDMTWDSPPAVTLGLEFRHADVCAFFDLRLGGAVDAVTVRAILFETPVADRFAGLLALGRAIADVRIPRRASGRGAPAPNGRLLPR